MKKLGLPSEPVLAEAPVDTAHDDVATSSELVLDELVDAGQEVVMAESVLVFSVEPPDWGMVVEVLDE